MIYCLLPRGTLCAFPVERDVREITGFSPDKDWLVFMERRHWLCLRLLTQRLYFSLHDVLKCMAGGRDLNWRCLRHDAHCNFKIRGLNILTNGISSSPTNPHLFNFTFNVHLSFSINVTIIFFKPITSHCGNMCFERLGVGNRNNILPYTGPLYPQTFVDSRSSMPVSLSCANAGCIEIEYDVSTNYGDSRNIYGSSEASPLFLWAHFRGACFRFQVDIFANVVLFITPCISCKIIAYDGPSYVFPPIMQFTSGLKETAMINASTFLLFVLLVDNNELTNTSFFYKTDKVQARVKNVTTGNQLIKSNNGSRCENQTGHALFCYYKFTSFYSQRIQLSLRKLRFHGQMPGGKLFAGVAVFDVIDGDIVKFCELYDDIEDHVRDFTITSTQNTIYVVIYSYIQFTTVDFEILAATTKCNTLTLGTKSDAYQTKLNDGTPYSVFLNRSLVGYGSCLRVQVIIFCWKQIYQLVLHTDVPMKLFSASFVLDDAYGFSTPTSQISGTYYRISSGYSKYGFHEYSLGTFNRIWLGEFVMMQYSYLEFIATSCMVPCNDLKCSNKLDTVSACDICRNHYIGDDNVLIQDNISFVSETLSKRCLASPLFMRVPIPCQPIRMYLAIRFKAYSHTVVALPSVSATTLFHLRGSRACCTGIPIHVIRKRVPQYALPCYKNSIPNMSIWKGYLYTFMSNPHRASWCAARNSCHLMHGFLLTIDSETEYDFVRRTFLSTYDAMVLYVGMKKEVSRGIK